MVIFFFVLFQVMEILRRQNHKDVTDLWKSFAKVPDLEICSSKDVGRNGSIVLLSMCSDFLCEVFKTVPEQVRDEKATLIIPEFPLETLDHFIDYVENGEAFCHDQKSYDDLNDLVEMLRIKTLEAEEKKVEVIIKEGKEEESCNAFDIIGEETEVEGKEEEEWEDKPKKRRKETKKRKPYRKRGTAPPPKPPPGKPGRPKIVKPENRRIWQRKGRFGQREPIDFNHIGKKERTRCGTCGEDIRTLEKCTDHFKEPVEQVDRDYWLEASGYKRKTNCRICRRVIVDDHSLRIHMADHVDEFHAGTTACKQCDHPFSDVIEYFCHLPSHSHVEKTNETKTCEYCGKTLLFSSYANHFARCKRIASGNAYMCDFCSFKTMHYNYFHGQNLRYSCPHCDKKFFQKSKVADHIRSKHQVIKSYSDQCPAEFTTKGSLRKHVRSCHEKLNIYECRVCQKKFSNRQAANKHVVIHTDLEPWKCVQCDVKSHVQSSSYFHAKKTGHEIVFLKTPEFVAERTRLIVVTGPEPPNGRPFRARPT